MQRNLRRLVNGMLIVAALVAALAVPAAAAPAQDSETIAASAQSAAGKCRWVWRIGLVCETKTGTITI